MKRNDLMIILILSGIIALFIAFRKPIKKTVEKIMTRGYRNNNPGNIRKTYDRNGKQTFWKGEIAGKDKDFKTFQTMSYGYRALFALLREYMTKGFNTIETIISRYAPSTENKTEIYINTVVSRTGIPRNEILNFGQVSDIRKMVKAISYVENGTEANDSDVNEGFTLLYAT